ncbi:RNA methyltransferase [Candidatus Dojkabacteria bacterium]|jgi:tRNA G18 (ribose-2'-O)-methylase SpoU|nr:RNA methyltransferase [Candidatus Dojkabacteria bacterium]
MKGYFGIGVYKPKFDENIGTLIRSAMSFDAAFIFTISGKAGVTEKTNTSHSEKHIPFYKYKTIEHFFNSIPLGSQLIAVETSKSPKYLGTFYHPERCIYLLGSEGAGLPEEVLKKCDRVVTIDSKPPCLNVAVSGSIVMYDRFVKGTKYVAI